MSTLTLFGGAPIPKAPRVVPFVFGIDRPTEQDAALMSAFVAELQFVIDLTAVPNTPFSGRFGFRPPWH